jgi:hypothetical protein
MRFDISNYIGTCRRESLGDLRVPRVKFQTGTRREKTVRPYFHLWNFSRGGPHCPKGFPENS